MFESEFFGYLKGAFTGAASDKKGYLDAANGGTLFLDEVGEIPSSLQVKLLRTLENKSFIPVGDNAPKQTDVRIVAATNQDLSQLVSKGEMRMDFFFRINVIPIRMPNLRERGEDVLLLVEHFPKWSDTPVSKRVQVLFRMKHPDIKGVSFVGSTKVGNHIYTTAAAHGKRVQALCEAKNHALVLRDCKGSSAPPWALSTPSAAASDNAAWPFP